MTPDTNHDSDLLPWLTPYWQHYVKPTVKRAHAYLIHGTQGVGKHLFVENWCRYVVNSGRDPDRNNIADLLVLMPEDHFEDGNYLSDLALRFPRKTQSKKPGSWITVDQVRALTDAMSTTTYSSSYKVVVIGYADRLNHQASNSFLKTLEEPASNTLILIVTNHLERISATVRSRCVNLHIKIPAQDQTQRWLASQGYSERQIKDAINLTSGSPLAAQALLASNKTEQRRALLGQLEDLLFSNNTTLSGLDKIEKSNGTESVIEHMQRVLIEKIKLTAGETAATSAQLSPIRLHRSLTDINKARELLGTSVEKRLLLEDLVLSVQRQLLSNN